MLSPRHLLLACHGTDGARAALSLALSIAKPGTTCLHHLFVVPDLWAGMQGDDWLNNASTRDDFGRYVEGLLEREAREQLQATEAAVRAAGCDYSASVRIGEPAPCLLESAARTGAECVVIGSPRPKGRSGLRSRMALEPLVRGLHVPLLIAPWPADER